MVKPLEVTFYTRSGCHLCEDAEAQLTGLARQFGLPIRTVDITRDPAAYDRWWADIPVVEIGARVLRAPIDLSHLQRTIHEAVRDS